MKKKSIVLLIIAAALIVIGAAMCLISNSVARSNGIDIFYQQIDDEGNAYEEKEFSSNSVSKISISLEKADVYVIGGAEKTSIVYKNYPVGTYSLVTANRTMNFDDGIGILSLFDITKSGFSFTGFRQYLNFDRFSEKDRSVYVYLSDGDVKQYEIILKSGDVRFENIDFEADVVIELGKGNVTLDCEKLSSAKVSIDEGNLTLKSNSFEGSLKATLKNGDAKIITPNKNNRNYSLIADGRIMVFGVEYPSPYTFETPLAVRTDFTVNVENGKIDMESPITEVNQETVDE